MNAAAAGTSRPRLDPAAFPSLGPGQLRPGRDHDAIDGLLPQAVLTPREPAHILAAIAEARAKRLGIVTSGGGTLLHIGAPPAAYDVRLSMTAISRILEQNPADMTVSCEAGVSLSRLQRSLAKQGQRLAIDAAMEDRASIGGIVATNATGGLRHGFGLPRDLVLGLTAIDGHGRTLVAGGRVVKNVAGYDLVRLLTGSWGGLAILTEVTLRTHPLPEAAATLVFEFVSPAELEAARTRLVAEPLPLAAVDFAVDTSEATTLWILVVRIEGSEKEVAAQGDRVCAAIGREPSDAVEDWTSPFHVDAPGGLTVRIATPPAAIVGAVRSVLAKLKDMAARPVLLAGGHLACGIARFHVPAADADAATPSETGREQRAAFDALWAATSPDDVIRTRVLERAPADVKARTSVWGDPPPSVALMRAIKQKLDPVGVLAPGRFVGGL